jgi:TonB family protein
MRFRSAVAVTLLVGLQPSLCRVAAAESDGVPACAPTPKLISFGNEYQTRVPPPAGSVVVEVTIETSGRVSAARIVKSSNLKLNELALDDAEEWVFEPPSVACRAQISVDYRIE